MSRLWLRTLLVTTTPGEVEPAAGRHREHLARLRDSGKLRLSGELEQGDGFVEIFEAADRLEADAIGRSSPLVEEGLAAWTVREWFETWRA